MPTSERDKRLRAELAAELGWYPADLDDESIARHRADAARKQTDHDPAKRWAHLTERARQREVEAAGRAAVVEWTRAGTRSQPVHSSPIMGCRVPRSVRRQRSA